MEKSQQPHSDSLTRKSESMRVTDASEQSARNTVLDMTTDTAEAVEKLKKARGQYAARKKWGYVLMALGIITVLDAASPIPIPLVGSPALVFGSILTVLGGALTIEPPRMRQTNEAILVGMRNGNRLTVPLLALQMDISLNKAEKIIAQLVKGGVAEIDLDIDDPDGGISYRLRGV
jgi:uncharacterized membrane protein YkoI